MASVTKERYLSPAFLERERQRLWPRVWQVAGPLADLVQPGDWFTFELGQESVLVVRGPDRVRAFHNVCMHRGRALRDAGRGHDTKLVCPYHHWHYRLDGKLLSLPSEPSFAGCFEREGAGLTEVAAECFAGFVWVCLAQPREALPAFLGPLADRLAACALDGYALVEDQTAEVACNWKVGVDAFNEAYHLNSVHPELIKMLDPARVERERFGRHNLISVPARDHSAWNRQYFVFPNTTFNLYGDQLLLLRHRPHPTDPQRMLMGQQQFARLSPGAPRPPRPRATVGASLGSVTDQDIEQLVRVQRGMRSSGFEGPIFGEQESLLLEMHRALDEYLDIV